MQVSLTLSALASALAAVFCMIGLIHLVGPRFLRDAFEKWNYGTGVRLFVGALEIGAALMIAYPELRIFGIGLAGLIMFGAVITLLSHEQYRCAAASLVLMVALIPAGLAVPRVSHQVHYGTVQTVSVPTLSGERLAQNGHAL